MFPKPSFIVFTIVCAGRVVKARKRETRKRAMNAFSFNLVVRNMIAIILMPTRIEVFKILMSLNDYYTLSGKIKGSRYYRVSKVSVLDR